MLHKTLGAMAASGMHDTIEGGFFRYATTREWNVPHYEKMLEDNAELLAVYAEAHRTFPEAGYDRVVRDVVRWMDTVLWLDDVKAFAGSQDADEVYYELDEAGHAKHGAPFVDRTIYTNWNALAVSAYVAAADALGDDAIEERAHQVVRAIAARMLARPGGQLLHFDRGDGPRVADLLGDRASFLQAALDEYETGKHRPALAGAIQAATTMRERLEDAADGGFFDAPERAEPGRVALREKPIEDNALAADGLLRLAALTGDEQWRETAVRTLQSFVGSYRAWGQFASSYANAVARALAEPLAITVVGPKDDATAMALWSVARSVDDPARSIQRIVPDEDGARLEQHQRGPALRRALRSVGFGGGSQEGRAAGHEVMSTGRGDRDEPNAADDFSNWRAARGGDHGTVRAGLLPPGRHHRLRRGRLDEHWIRDRGPLSHRRSSHPDRLGLLQHR